MRVARRNNNCQTLASWLVLSIICSVIDLCASQNCDLKQTCDLCIQELNCFWCTSLPNNGSTHCLAKTQQALCDEANTQDPKQSFTILKENKLTESEQIKPQRVQLKLGKNEKFELNFQYRQSANYPVDLYYIMDLSHSMEQFKDNLANLGGKLAEEMKRKTNNFQIGFGSFVDKLTLPYVNVDPTKVKSPCDNCTAPYSFKNHLALINDATLFSTKVKGTKMSGNLDSPEGGLDAIMQAMVCTQEIGWRLNARHLLVMSTDAVSHIAGDGKLGGVIEPNDATCHMKNNAYTDDLIYDYPSISQINYVARQKNINLIFAVVLRDAKDPQNLKSHYEAMSNIIENSKTGTLVQNSDNVVKFISDIYDEIRDAVKITSDANKDVNVTISSTCPGFVEGECSSVKPGQIINFKAVIEPLVCHKDPKLNKKTIKIKPEGLEDSLIIELEVLCDCPCAALKEPSHKSCNYQGDLECGICRCKDDRIGVNCECDRTQNIEDDPSLCIKPGDKNVTCSGQGKCKCGVCQCKPRPVETEVFSGKYCECDNFSCYLQCSGRGTCECGKCINCDKGWGGAGCECSTDTSQCMPPNKKETCSGHGECVCGQCQCFKDGKERYSGKYCEDCTSCSLQRCDELKHCVECQAYNSGPYGNSTSCKENCTIFTTNIVEKLNETTAEDTTRCRVVVDKDCSIVFEYLYDKDKNLIVVAEEKKHCDTLPPALLPIILGVIGSVLLVGIVTLVIWKIVTTVHDKNEYARFMQERNNTQWAEGENPLYKPGTSHFQNPAYKRASYRASQAFAAAKKAQLEAN